MKTTRRNFLASLLVTPAVVALCKEEEKPKDVEFAKGLFQIFEEMKKEGFGGYAVLPEVRADLMWEMNRDKLWDYNAPRIRSVFSKNGERYL